MTEIGAMYVLTDHFIKEENGKEEKVTGMTVIIEGTLRDVFDAVKKRGGYYRDEDVFRDILIEGIDTILTEKGIKRI